MFLCKTRKENKQASTTRYAIIMCNATGRSVSQLPVTVPLLDLTHSFKMPKAANPKDGMKQKSLMSFFGKATPAKTKQDTSSKKNPIDVDELEEPVDSTLRTPSGKGASQSSGINSAKYSRSSDGGESAFETPPTSDPIDVDMSSEVDEETTTDSVSCWLALS